MSSSTTRSLPELIFTPTPMKNQLYHSIENRAFITASTELGNSTMIQVLSMHQFGRPPILPHGMTLKSLVCGSCRAMDVLTTPTSTTHSLLPHPMSRTYMRLTSLRIQRDYRKITLNYMQLHLFGCKSSVAILKD